MEKSLFPCISSDKKEVNYASICQDAASLMMMLCGHCSHILGPTPVKFDSVLLKFQPNQPTTN